MNTNNYILTRLPISSNTKHPLSNKERFAAASNNKQKKKKKDFKGQIQETQKKHCIKIKS